MPIRRRLWLGMTLVLPIAFTIITLTRRSDPPDVEMEVVPMPELPALNASDAGPRDGGLAPDGPAPDATAPAGGGAQGEPGGSAP